MTDLSFGLQLVRGLRCLLERCFRVGPVPGRRRCNRCRAQRGSRQLTADQAGLASLSTPPWFGWSKSALGGDDDLVARPSSERLGQRLLRSAEAIALHAVSKKLMPWSAASRMAATAAASSVAPSRHPAATSRKRSERPGGCCVRVESFPWHPRSPLVDLTRIWRMTRK